MSSWLVYYGNGYTAAGWDRTQKANNVDIIAAYFYSLGWTINAIAGLLGNMEKESYINPGQWQHGFPIENPNVSTGFGLVQWTPWTKYTMWAGSDWKTNYNKQLYRITYEVAVDDATPNQGQWISKPSYPMSFTQFTQSTASASYLAMAFFTDYERGVGGETERQNNAEYWFSYLLQNPPGPWVPPGPGPEPPGPGPGPTPPSGKPFKIMFYLKPWWKRL